MEEGNKGRRGKGRRRRGVTVKEGEKEGRGSREKERGRNEENEVYRKGGREGREGEVQQDGGREEVDKKVKREKGRRKEWMENDINYDEKQRSSREGTHACTCNFLHIEIYVVPQCIYACTMHARVSTDHVLSHTTVANNGSKFQRQFYCYLCVLLDKLYTCCKYMHYCVTHRT